MVSEKYNLPEVDQRLKKINVASVGPDGMKILDAEYEKIYHNTELTDDIVDDLQEGMDEEILRHKINYLHERDDNLISKEQERRHKRNDDKLKKFGGSRMN